MGQSENIEQAKAAYAAFAAGDVEAASANLDDDIEWVVPGNSTRERHLSRQGRDRRVLDEARRKGFTTTPEHFLGDDERVVVLTRVTAGGESSDAADVLTFRDGKVVKFQSAGDTAMQERVWGSK